MSDRPSPDSRRVPGVSTLVLGTTLLTLVVVALPALWLGRVSFERAHREDELTEVAFAHGRAAADLDERLAAAESSIARFAALLDQSLQLPRPGDADRLDALVERGADGARRSRREFFDGRLGAGLFLPAGLEPDEPLAALMVAAKRLIDLWARGNESRVWDNLWVLPAQGGEVILWPSDPEFVFQAAPDLDYRDTLWVSLTRPEHDPEGQPRWTPCSFDETSDSWLLSVVAPFHQDGVWAGAVGHDVSLPRLADVLGGHLPEGSDLHLVRADGTLLMSSRHQSLIESSHGGARAKDTGDALLVDAVLAGAPEGVLRRAVADDDRTLLSERSPRNGWRLVAEVPHSSLLADVRGYYGELWMAFVAIVTGVALLPALVVSRRVRSSVRQLVRASRMVRVGEPSVPFPIEGPREFRTIAEAIEGMVTRLGESEERTRAVLETVADGVISVDEQGLVQSANASAARMFGLGREALVGSGVARLGPAFEQVQELLTGNDETSTWSLDSAPEALHASGRLFPVEVKARVTVAGGRHLMTLTVRDLTRRRQAEVTRAALETQLRQAQKMEAIGQLAGGVAHDFNNLLTGIMGYAEGLLETLPAEGEAAHDLSQILRAAERAAGLTRQLLLFSRRQEARPEQVCLNRLLTSITPMLQRLLGEAHELSVDLAPTLGSVRVDPAQMEQVVMNLVVNAADAMPEGGPILLTTRGRQLPAAGDDCAPMLEAGPYVTVAVTDTGTGMDEAVQATIFEPFFTTKEPGKGTGLGLSTVFGIVQESGGQVQVLSAPGLGSTFTVWLPWVGSAEPGREIADQRLPPGGSETVLVAEDESTVRRLVQRLLQDQGYRVLVAEDGDSALQLADAHEGSIDLLLTDIVMPGMSGPSLAQELLRRRTTTRVLFMSGWPADALASSGLQVVPAEIVAKPFGLADMCRRVRAALDGVSQPA